ncbi:MAG: hypothetical protein JWQ01_243 [Massilia sp.]|jgi:hypothetical protein|nr:hypothetical protein [Massilia sp.]
MKPCQVASSLFLAALLGGCVSPAAYVDKSSLPSPQAGYVGAQFVSTSAKFISALVLENVVTQQEYVLPFANQAFTSTPHVETGMLALPPGKYKIAKWLAYNSTSKGTEFTRKISSGLLARDFEVSTGKVVFLGKLSGGTTWTPAILSARTESGIQAMPVTDLAARKLLADSYPAYSSMAFACLLCAPANPG